MGLDIRNPLGYIFLALGTILVVYGATTYGSKMYAMSMGVNINLVWGTVMFIFGGAMVWAARKR
jgi:hypothetical protein